jgi:Ribosomal RNA adenine dimethylase
MIGVFPGDFPREPQVYLTFVALFHLRAGSFMEQDMRTNKRGPRMSDPSSMGERIWRSKSLSQNFLRDSRLIESLVLHSGITKTDTVLDLGAGKGLITWELAVGSPVDCRQ